MPPNKPEHYIGAHGLFANHDAIRAATGDILESMSLQLQLDTPLVEDYFRETFLRSPSPLSPASPPPPGSLLSLPCRGSESIEGEWHIPAPSMISGPVEFWPSSVHWSHCYTHIKSVRMSSEGPLQLVKHKESGNQFIIKTIDDVLEAELPREAAVLFRSLEPHPHIVRLEACFWGDRECHMVLEYCSGGDLENLVNFCATQGQRLPSQFILHFIAEMIIALAYLHECAVDYLRQPVGSDDDDKVWTLMGKEPVLHRDIKPGNIFLRWDQARSEYGMPTIVLGDFGHACAESDNESAHGTLGFVAPEVEEVWDRMLLGDRYDPTAPVCSKVSDMYSFGATLFNLITFEDYTPGADIQKAWEKSTVKDYSFVLYILQGCLMMDPADRLGVEPLLHLPGDIKKLLREWYSKGGRMEVGTWPDPRWLEEQIEAEEVEAERAEQLSSLFLDHVEDGSVESESMASEDSPEWLQSLVEFTPATSEATGASTPASGWIDREIFDRYAVNLFNGQTAPRGLDHIDGEELLEWVGSPVESNMATIADSLEGRSPNLVLFVPDSDDLLGPKTASSGYSSSECATPRVSTPDYLRGSHGESYLQGLAAYREWKNSRPAEQSHKPNLYSKGEHTQWKRCMSERETPGISRENYLPELDPGSYTPERADGLTAYLKWKKDRPAG